MELERHSRHIFKACIATLTVVGCASPYEDIQAAITNVRSQSCYEVSFKVTTTISEDSTPLVISGVSTWHSPNVTVLLYESFGEVAQWGINIGKETWLYYEDQDEWVELASTGKPLFGSGFLDPDNILRSLQAHVYKVEGPVSLPRNGQSLLFYRAAVSEEPLTQLVKDMLYYSGLTLLPVTEARAELFVSEDNLISKVNVSASWKYRSKQSSNTFRYGIEIEVHYSNLNWPPKVTRKDYAKKGEVKIQLTDEIKTKIRQATGVTVD